MYAVVMLLRAFPELLQGRSSVCFVDNMGVIHNIVNGAARAIDLSVLALSVHRLLAQLASTFWWEYVESASNIADGGSRDGISCQLAAAEGITLADFPFYGWPRNFPFSGPEDFDEWFALTSA